jgi:hypothetical protein
MPQSSPVPSPGPPRLGPEWSTLIVIVAILFLLAVWAFYFYAS